MKGGSKFKLKTGSLGVSWSLKYCESEAISQTPCGSCRWQPCLLPCMETARRHKPAAVEDAQDSRQWLSHTVCCQELPFCYLVQSPVVSSGMAVVQRIKWRQSGDIRLNHCYTSATRSLLSFLFLDLLAKKISKIDSFSSVPLLKRLQFLSMDWTYFFVFHPY